MDLNVHIWRSHRILFVRVAGQRGQARFGLYAGFGIRSNILGIFHRFLSISLQNAIKIDKNHRMTRECSRMFLTVSLVLKQPSKDNFWTSKLIFELSYSIFWTSIPSNSCPTAQNWTSMSISGGPTAYLMGLNVHFWRSHRILNGPRCPFLAVPPHIKWTSLSLSLIHI